MQRKTGREAQASSKQDVEDQERRRRRRRRRALRVEKDGAVGLGGETGVMRGGGDVGDSSRRRRRRHGGRNAGSNEGIRESGREGSRRGGSGGGRAGGRTTSLEELAWRKSAQYTDELRGELADLMSTEGSRRRARMGVHHQQQGAGAGRAGPTSSSVLLSSSSAAAAAAAQFAKPLQITSLDRVLRDSAQHGKHAAHLYSKVHVGAPSSYAETKRFKKRFADGSHMYLSGGAGGAGGAGGRGGRSGLMFGGDYADGRHLHGASHRESTTSGRWLAGQGATDRIHITTAFMHAHSLKQ